MLTTRLLVRLAIPVLAIVVGLLGARYSQAAVPATDAAAVHAAAGTPR